MNETAYIAIVVIVVLIIAAALIFMEWRNRHTKHLKSQFGPEYSRAVEAAGSRGKAEADLLEREKRVEAFDLKPLDPEARRGFTERWSVIQSEFVDTPNRAVADADALTVDVMTARGYPMSEFDQRAADISVDHPQVVQNYRTAHAIALRNAKDGADTEDLRQATVAYRALFEELVGDGQGEEHAPAKA
ncbi:MAG: hypothetical protein ACREEB_09435 [Caulobacteraceae bacterium]